MVSRREILSGFVVAPALTLPWARSGQSATAMVPTEEAAVVGAVFDERFLQSRAFAARATSRNIRSFGFAGEMSGIWFDQLRPAVRANPGPLVGLTGAGALFCFEQLAWEVGMRVRLRIHHAASAGGLRHFTSTQLPPAMLARLETANAAFGPAAVDVALGCRGVWGNCTHATVPGIADPSAESLVTWVIAPLNLI